MLLALFGQRAKWNNQFGRFHGGKQRADRGWFADYSNPLKRIACGIALSIADTSSRTIVRASEKKAVRSKERN